MNDPRYTEAEHLAALRAGVSKTAREHFSDRERLVPILAPASLVGEGTWVGPFEPLAAPGLGLENLRRLSSEKWTYEFKRESGEIWGVGVMQTDACGPSRLLLADVWKALFPFGYRMAAPERSCALVFSKHLDPVESSKIDKIIAACYESGTRPLARETFEQWQLTPVAP